MTILVEKCVSSEINIFVDDFQLYNIYAITFSQQTVEQIEVNQEVVSSELSKLNRLVMCKTLGDHIQLYPEKRLHKKENRDSSHPTILHWLVDHVI